MNKERMEELIDNFIEHLIECNSDIEDTLLTLKNGIGMKEEEWQELGWNLTPEYAESGLNPSICPYCGSENTEQIDFDWDNASAKHICRDCNQDYIAWYDDTTEECYEITDRHNKIIKRMED